jgi:hypothetical protein
MEDAMSWHMLPCLNLVETIDLSRVNRQFNRIVQKRVGLRAPQILQLQTIFRSWRMLKQQALTRNNSWARVRYNPDDRIIF